MLDGAEVAIEAHRLTLGIEGDKEIQLWHLLVSLLDYCEANAINFDANLSGAKHYRSERGNP